MPGCSTGRNIQKFKGSGASTLQDALENGNTATIDIVLDNAVFHGDGGGLSNISGVGGSVGNLQQVTTAGGTASNKITLTNTNVSLETSGNVTVGNNKFFLGDGGLLSNTAGVATLQQAVTQGNVTTLTTSFTNTAESITTTGNVIVGTNVHATEFVGDGSSLTSLSAGNISAGTLAIARGGTGASTLDNLITMGTHTTGDFVGTITGGDGIASTAGTSGEDTDHTLSVDTKADGGLVFESNKLAVKLDASSITGTLAVGDGGTGATTLNNLITMGTHTTGNFVQTITGGDGIASTGATSGENIAHTLSVDTKADGGLVFESNKLAVKLDASSITGTLAIGDGGTGSTTASGAASALGLGTEDSPEFTGISLGSTAITESSGTVSIGGNAIRTGDVALGSQTSGNYVKTVTVGDGLDMSGSAGEGSEHTLSLDLKANHGLAIDSTELKIDLKTSGGLEFDSGKLGVKLDDTSISGTLPASKGGTGLTGDDLVHGRIIFANSSNTFTALPVDPTGTKYLKSAGADANPVWTSVSEEASPTPGSLTAGNGLASSSGTFNGSGDRTFSVDPLTNGGIVFDSGSDNAKKLLVNLGASSITGEVDKTHGGTGATEVTGTAGNNVLSVSPTLTGTTSVANISASGNIVGVIAGSNTISGSTITATNLVGPGSGISALNASNVSSGKLTVPYGGTGHNSIATNSLLAGNGTGNMTVISPNTSGTKYLKSVGTDGAISWDTVTATISIGTDNTDADRDLLFTTDDSDLKRDSDNKIKYNPDSNTLKIIDTAGKSNTLTSLTWSGNAASADILSTARYIGGTPFDGSGNINIANVTIAENSTDNTDYQIPFLQNVDSNTFLNRDSTSDTHITYNPSTNTLTCKNIAGSGTNITALNAENITSGVLDVDHGGTNIDSYAVGDLLYASGTTTLSKLNAGSAGQFLKLDMMEEAPEWSDIVSEETNTDASRGIVFENGNSLKEDEDVFFYNSKTGNVQTSNILTSSTGANARNGISNTNSNHTLSIGTKIICEEVKNTTYGNDALRVNGNVVVVDYILGNGRYLQGINIQQDSNGSDTVVTNDGAPPQRTRLARFNA